MISNILMTLNITSKLITPNFISPMQTSPKLKLTYTTWFPLLGVTSQVSPTQYMQNRTVGLLPSTNHTPQLCSSSSPSISSCSVAQVEYEPYLITPPALPPHPTPISNLSARYISVCYTDHKSIQPLLLHWQGPSPEWGEKYVLIIEQKNRHFTKL